MEYNYSFGYQEHPKVPGQYYITRNGRVWSPPQKKTKYLSEDQAHATIRQFIQEISDAERARQEQS